MIKLERLRNFKAGLHLRPANLKLLLKDNYKSYYPDDPHKGKPCIFYEQLWQIITKGDYCADYFFYGLDRKSINKKDYVTSYWEFMKKRDYLNLHDSHNSSCLLRNKFYFGQYAQSLGGGHYDTRKCRAIS